MKNLIKYLPWTIRIIVFLLFSVSAIAKMFPLWAFEKQLVDLGFASWCTAPFWARFIIALELAAGIAMLQRNYLKKIVIPGTILLLVVFSIHLIAEIFKHGAMSGNCGCFGQLIPMTPLEALIKNIVTIGLLLYLFKILPADGKGQGLSVNLLVIYLSAALFMFVVFPFCPCKKEISIQKTGTPIHAVFPMINTTLKKGPVVRGEDTTIVIVKPSVESGPQKVKSRFSNYSNFEGKFVDLDEGKKIICLFSPTCEHCQEKAKKICELAKSKTFPEVFIYFANEEPEKIPEFFKKAGCEFPYQLVQDFGEFWTLFGNGMPPGIFYLWNGNIIKSYQGEGDEEFEESDLLKAIQEIKK